MAALIVIGIVLAVLALVCIAYFIHKQSKENFGVSPFSLGKLAFVAVAVAIGRYRLVGVRAQRRLSAGVAG